MVEITSSELMATFHLVLPQYLVLAILIDKESEEIRSSTENRYSTVDNRSPGSPAYIFRKLAFFKFSLFLINS